MPSIMGPVEIGDLFDNYRFPDGIQLLLVLLYFPFGIMLAIVRLFIGFHTFLISCVLPKMTLIRSIVLRTMCSVLGIIVTTEGFENRDKKAKILVANYTSTLDHLATDLVVPSILPSVWGLPPALMWMLGYKDMGATQGREALMQNAKKHCRESDIPLLAFPEGASTNGKKGLLKFSVWPFSLDQPLQPMLIQLHRPLLTKISPSVLGGRWWIDVFWFLFVPYTVFHIKLLPVVEEREDELPEEFTKRVQQLIAGYHGVVATSHTSADKVEYTKRKLFIQTDQGSTSGTGSSGGDNSLDLMVYQVKEVLPDVPVQTIKTDLALTKDVDLTITNILEGRVVYTPEVAGVEATAEVPTPSRQVNIAASSKLTSAMASAKEFSKNSQLRAMSLKDRKQALLDYARRKYMEKHGML